MSVTLFLASVSLVGLSGLALHAAASRVGDAQHGNTETGMFYIFGPEIVIVDPETGVVQETLPGVESWGDAVYMRDHAQINHYAFANDRQDGNLWVIDTDAQEVLSMIDTGDNPVHLYAIPPREEIWTHPDTDGAFDILHLGDLEYLAHSNLKAHDETPGHGKLLWDPNLQDQAFATNENEPKIYELDLEERTMEHVVNMTLDSAPYECAATHYIGYSYVNQHLYVECLHPGTCEEPYTDGKLCSGSTWEVDVATRTPVARLVSPALHEDRGDSFGAQGQIFATPDERFLVVTNRYQNYVHFLKPVNGENTTIIDVPVGNKPNKAAFWPKNGKDVWGPDSMLADYWVVIAQEEQVDEAGVVMIDLEQVSAAFEEGSSGEDIEVDEIAAGAGAHNRPIARGSHYVMTPSDATSTDGDYTQVAIIDLDTQEVKHMLDIAGTERVLWVPTHNDEKVANHEIRITALEDAQASNSGSDSRGVDENVEIMAEAAVALAVVGVVGAMMALWISVRNARHAKRVSEGEFKPFACI